MTVNRNTKQLNTSTAFDEVDGIEDSASLIPKSDLSKLFIHSSKPYFSKKSGVKRISITTPEDLINEHVEKTNFLISDIPFNTLRRINKVFEAVNENLPQGGVFIGSGITTGIMRQTVLKNYPRFIASAILSYCYFFHRVIAKISMTKKLYYSVTKGKNRIVSRAEILGRLICCGFEIVDERTLNNNYYFAARKVKKPKYDLNPTYGIFIRLPRVGKDGKLFSVYKFRTMHPYSEYLQKYIHDHNGIQDNGKFENDFRINPVGRIMRKLWIDELPMFINILKRQLKLVGVRPLSQHYYSLYPEEMQQRRIQYKPGLLPPYYVDLPKSFEKILESEKKYLDLYDKHPIFTDIRYFFLILYNIIIKRARSK